MERTETPAVVITDLHVRRGKNPVLDGLSVTVARSAVAGVLGPSGCSKTTLLRAIVGVQVVRSGTVTVLGEPAGFAGLRSPVGHVTQQASVHDDLTVRQNLQYFAAVLPVHREDVDRVLEATARGALSRPLAGCSPRSAMTRARSGCCSSCRVYL